MIVETDRNVTYLFVYGILRPDYGTLWRHYFPKAKKRGYAWAKDHALLLGQIAAMTPYEGRKSRGFVFEIGKDFNFSELDRLEAGYDRLVVEAEVDTPGPNPVRAYAYIRGTPYGSGPELLGEDYIEFLTQTSRD